MTLHLVVATGILALLLLLWVLDLTRRGRLYVGYAVVLASGILVALALISVPGGRSVLSLLSGGTGALRPLLLLAFSSIGVLLIYTLSQLTIISNRLTRLVQELALRQVKEQSRERNDPGQTGDAS